MPRRRKLALAPQPERDTERQGKPSALRNSVSRRAWLLRSVALGSVLGLIAHRQPSHAASQGTLIEQPEPADPGGFMARAYRMKREAVESGDQSYGAVIVRSGRIVGQAPSRVVVNEDPTAHAEMEAIRDAARRLDTRDLHGCVMFSSSPPCPMCEAAAYWAGIDGLFHGSNIVDRGAPRLTRC